MRIHPTPDRFTAAPAAPGGQAELIVDAQHFDRVVRRGILQARVSLDIATADFKGMLIPSPPGTTPGNPGAVPGIIPGPGKSRQSRRRSNEAPSIVAVLAGLARRGVEVRVMHSGVPSSAALHELRGKLPENLVIRRCPRLHAKAVVIDAARMYLGSANLTGAGLGAKHADKRNIEWGVWTESSALIDAVMQQFNALWEGERCRKCRRKDICPVPLEEPAL